MILFNLVSKGIILLIFFTVGPYLLKKYAISYTDERLAEKRQQVLGIIYEEGLESFFHDENSGYGSYNLLKEEYISLERVETPSPDTIFNEERIIEEEVVMYRVLSHSFVDEGQVYLLEIGRSLATIYQIERVLSTFTLIAFIGFIILTVGMDTTFHTFLFQPFRKIIYEKLPEISEPHLYDGRHVQSSTKDFQILDEAIDNMMNRIQQVFNREREFIAHASHELRTPISILQSKIENMLSESELKDQDMQRLMDMQQTIQRFKHIVNSLLLISKISNAQFVKKDIVDLRELARELTEEWEPIAREKGLRLDVECDESLKLSDSNYSMALMLIQNALINAIRYTPGGGNVKLSVRVVDDKAVVEVSDNGPGIPQSLLEQVRTGIVFLKDARSDRSGFGLQIIHRIAAYLDVDCAIDSSSKGTTIQFTFRQPVRIEQGQIT